MHFVNDQRTKKVSIGFVMYGNKPGELSYLRSISLKAIGKSIQIFFSFVWTDARQRLDQAKIRPMKTKCYYIMNTIIRYRLKWHRFKMRIDTMTTGRWSDWKGFTKTFFWELPKIEKEINLSCPEFDFLDRIYQTVIMLIIRRYAYTIKTMNCNYSYHKDKLSNYMYCPFQYRISKFLCMDFITEIEILSLFSLK